MANNKRFEDRQLWSKAADLTCKVFELTKCDNLKNSGLLHDELQYNALFISSTIAEAYEKGHKEEVRLLQEAKGKSGALCSKLYVCVNLKLLREKDIIPLIKLCRSISSEIGIYREPAPRKPKPRKSGNNRNTLKKSSKGMGEMDTAEFLSSVRGNE